MSSHSAHSSPLIQVGQFPNSPLGLPRLAVQTTFHDVDSPIPAEFRNLLFIPEEQIPVRIQGIYVQVFVPQPRAQGDLGTMHHATSLLVMCEEMELAPESVQNMISLVRHNITTYLRYQGEPNESPRESST